MAIINVDDAYILNETGAQVDKTTGIPFKNESLTEAEAAQARANIRAGGTNPNLLDNAYFVGGGSQLGDGVFPINQRGLTTYNTAAWNLDRWYGACTLYSDYLYIPSFIKQSAAYPLNTPLTMSAMLADGTIVSGTATFTDRNTQQYFYTDGVNIQLVRGADGMPMIWTGVGVNVKAVKLEVGTVSTLANDAPPDFGDALRKCQRYLFIRDYAQNDIIANGLTNNLTMFLPASMRSGGSPTMTFTTTPYVIGNNVISTPTSVNLVSVNGNQVQIYAPTTESHNAQTIVLYAGSATRMTISNEL